MSKMSVPIVPFDPELEVAFQAAPPEYSKTLTHEARPALVAAYSKAPPVRAVVILHYTPAHHLLADHPPVPQPKRQAI